MQKQFSEDKAGKRCFSLSLLRGIRLPGYLVIFSLVLLLTGCNSAGLQDDINLENSGITPTEYAGNMSENDSVPGTLSQETANLLTAPTAVPAKMPTVEPTASPTPKPSPTPLPHIYSNDILFTPAEYFCSNTINVELQYDSTRQGTIYYTLDGSEPDENSYIYTGPIELEASNEESPYVYALRAVVREADGKQSKIYTHNYFVGTNVNTRYSTPVISIVGDEQDFYNETSGILADRNRYARGRKYEKPVYVTALSCDGTIVFEQDCGVRLIGGDSRSYPNPSLKLYARKEYSADRGYFPFDLFETPRYDKEGKTVKKYDKLVLRINGDDSQNTMMRDVLLHRLASLAGFENIESAVPAVVYLNGEYYTLVWVRENYCDGYFKRKYGDADGNFVVIEECETEKHYNATSDELEINGCKDFNRFYKKYAYSDLTNESNYEELSKLIDVEDYLRYYAFELYSANTDWPNNNLYCYRYYADSENGYSDGVFDGRWRFLLHDLDYSSAIYNAKEGNPASYNAWKVVMNENASRYSPLFTHLMQRDDCREYFINYTTELADDILAGEKVAEVIDALNDSRRGELPYYFKYVEKLRKRYLSGEIAYQVYFSQEILDKRIDTLKDFFNRRGEYAKTYIENIKEY